MCMHKIMISPVCLGILLLGIVITPSVFAGDGCGTGTVLVDGVCQLAPQESNDGCGAGTKMVNGVCQLDKSSGTSIPEFGVLATIGVMVIGVIVGVWKAIKRNVNNQKPSSPSTQSVSSTVGNVMKILDGDLSDTAERKARQQELEEYEEKYLARQGQRPTRKPAEKKETPMFCNNCGAAFKKSEAKFCGKCGSKV